MEVLASDIAMSARLSSDAVSVACVGRDRHTDGGGDLHRQAVEGDGLLEGPEQAAGEVQGAGLVDGAGDQDGELVAAEAGDGPGRARRRSRGRRATSMSRRSPCWWPNVSLTCLNSSRSRIRTAAPGDAALGHGGQGGGEPALEVRPVGQAGERVVQRVVPQLADELAVAQRDAGVVGDGLEQERVVVLEGADVAEPVGDDERSDDAGRPVERHDDGVAHLVLRQPSTRLRAAGVPRHEQRLRLLDDLAEHPRVLRGAPAPPTAISRPAASSRTRATRSPSGPMKAAVARSERSSSLASPSTLFMTSSSSTALLTAWLKR